MGTGGTPTLFGKKVLKSQKLNKIMRERQCVVGKLITSQYLPKIMRERQLVVAVGQYKYDKKISSLVDHKVGHHVHGDTHIIWEGGGMARNPKISQYDERAAI